jgi:flagellar hook-associated protein 1 FlgK
VSNILNSLIASAGALQAYDQVLQVTQNNVANASTPGFVKHRQSILALPFDPAGGLIGGLRAGEVLSARSAYADQAVRSQIFLEGQAERDVGSLTALESIFDISGESGIPSALNRLFQSFSAWGQSPNDTVARQAVIERGVDVAAAFRRTADRVIGLARQTEYAAGQSVQAINEIAGRIKTLNELARRTSQTDSGLDAQIHNALEELSSYASITTLEQEDGSVTVLLNGQTALVAGENVYPVSVRLVQPQEPPPVYTDAPPSLHLFGADGRDITAATDTGSLGSLLDTRNRVVASYIGDVWQAGDLNRFATQFASRVNELLVSGTAPDGSAGAPLFTLPTSATEAARSLTVDEAVLRPDRLGAAVAGPPAVANGVPLALSGLANPNSAADEIDGASFTEFYGRLAGRVGSELNDAESRLQVQQSAVAQARNLRQQMSGVSLDEEASILIQFQRAYEANSRLISVLDRLSQATIDMLQR